MIEDGQIFATINQKDGMVSFDENPEKYNTTAMLSSLDLKIKGTIDLAGRLRSVDEDIAVTPEYIQKTMSDRAGRWGPGDMDDFDMMHGSSGGRHGPPGFRAFGGPGGKGRKGQHNY